MRTRIRAIDALPDTTWGNDQFPSRGWFSDDGDTSVRLWIQDDGTFAVSISMPDGSGGDVIETTHPVQAASVARREARRLGLLNDRRGSGV